MNHTLFNHGIRKRVMGSVKDLEVREPASTDSLGEARFVFTDDYSVFDWGKMPDTIEGKGRSLCTMGAHNFELLESEGVPTHYRGVLEHDEVKSLTDTDRTPNTMAIDLTQTPSLPFNDAEGSYNYEAYHREGGDNYLVPLEVVFRNSVPQGSSLRKRMTPQEVGLEHESWPEEAVDLEEPVVEYSTKFEEQDRYLELDDARDISGLGDQFDELGNLALEVNRVVTEQASEMGLVHMDGKIECLYFDGELRVADVVGTFDENRFLYDDQQISKEFLRQFYKDYDPEWVDSVGEAKTEANERGIADWRSLCSVSPKPLPADVLVTASRLYKSGTNTYTDTDWFDTPPIDQVVEQIRNKQAA